MLTHTATRHPTESHGLRRGLRWVGRIALAAVALVAVALVAAIIFVHTALGRELERSLAENQLRSLFTGGGSIGRVEGSPFGELVLREIAINGPDGQPAISIGTLRVRAHLLDLVRKRVSLDELVAQDLDVELKRDRDGRLEIGRLLKPSPEAPQPADSHAESSWTVDLPAIQLRDAHVSIDTGTPQAGVVDLDRMTADVGVRLLGGGATQATLQLAATWRERRAPLAITVQLRRDAQRTAVPVLAVQIGGVTVRATAVQLLERDGRAPQIGGMLAVAAARADVLALVPSLALPDDLALRIAATTDGAIALDGTVGATPITARVAVDLDAARVTGTVATGELDVATLTHGAIAATAGAALDFDLARGAPGELPSGHAVVHAHGVYATLPRTDLVLAVDAHGQHVTADASITGAETARLTAAITRDGPAVVLDRAKLVASTRDPARASGGKAPVHGAIDVVLAAHGTLSPDPELAIAGRVHGRALRARSLSVASLDLAIDAADVPRRPRGTIGLRLADLVDGDLQLGALAVNAASRADGWIDVAVASHPKQARWLVELAARVKPPGRDGTTEVAIRRHHVRLGDAGDWSGTTGRIAIGPERIAIRNLESTSAGGSLAIAGSYDRAGPHAGDATLTVDASNVALQTLRHGYAGLAHAHVAVARSSGVISGTAEISALGVAFKPFAPRLELHAKVDASRGRVAATARAASSMGDATLDLQLAAPRDLTDVAAWKARGRAAVTLAKVELAKVDVGQVARLVRSDAQVSGTVDGELELTPAAVDGELHFRHVEAPPLKVYGAVDADLRIVRGPHDELEPQLAVAVASLGRATARADLRVPAHPFDPAAWSALGDRALRGASVQVADIAFDPGLLQRFGVTSSLRGHAGIDLEVGDGLSSIEAVANLWDLRGSPIARPVSARLDAKVDAKAATARLALVSDQKVAMLDLQAAVPISLAALRAHPAAVKALPLAASISIPTTSAPQLMSAFGRSEIVGGTLGGTISVAGTVGTPTATVHLTAEGLQVPPGPGGKPIKEVKQLAIDGSWDGHAVKIDVKGVEARGGRLALVVDATPSDLASATASVTATAFDLVPVLAFAPGPAGGAAGSLDGKVTVKGFDPRTAQVAGELHIKDARLPIAPEVGTLRDATVDLKIDSHDLKIAAIGKLGAGTLKIDGAVALDAGTLTGGQATLVLKHVSPIGAIQPKIDADVTAKLARKGTQWTADVVIDHGFVRVDTATGEKLKPVGGPPEMAFGNRPKPHAPQVARGAHVEPASRALVATVTLKPTPVESAQFRTTLKGKLEAVADSQGLDVKGAIAALGGDVDLFDRRYTIERARVTFDGSVDPILDVRISHEFTDVTTVAEVHGRASKPELALSAEPGTYTQSELLGFLLGGEPGGGTQSSSATDKAASAGESFLANQIGGYVKSSIPGVKLDVLKYEAASSTSSAAIAAGTWLTHTLFFQFTERLDAMPDENDEEGTLEYWITHRLELQLTAGDRNYDGLDVLWRKRY